MRRDQHRIADQDKHVVHGPRPFRGIQALHRSGVASFLHRGCSCEGTECGRCSKQIGIMVNGLSPGVSVMCLDDWSSSLSVCVSCRLSVNCCLYFVAVT